MGSFYWQFENISFNNYLEHKNVCNRCSLIELITYSNNLSSFIISSLGKDTVYHLANSVWPMESAITNQDHSIIADDNKQETETSPILNI